MSHVNRIRVIGTVLASMRPQRRMVKLIVLLVLSASLATVPWTGRAQEGNTDRPCQEWS